MKITGKIKQISVKGIRHAFLVGENWLSIFLNDKVPEETKGFVESLAEGDECDFDVAINKTEKGTFYNIQQIGPTCQEAVKKEDILPKMEWGEKERVASDPLPRADKTQRSINLSYAMQIMKSLIEADRIQFAMPEEIANYTVAIADEFNKYILEE